MMFTATNSQLTPMSMTEMMEACPNIFNKTPISTASEKYRVINVWTEVIKPLMKHGWFVRDAKATNSKKHGAKATFMVRLANMRLANKDRAPEIIITSSHDKRTPLSFRMGVLELVCSNGLVVVTEQVEELNKIIIRHKGEIEEKLQLVMQIIERETLALNSLFTRMQGEKLSKEAQQKLAQRALEMRGITAKADLDMELAIRTALQTAVDVNGNAIESQDGDSLFNVFQRIQGNIMKGKVLYRKQTTLVKAEKAYDLAKEEDDVATMEKLEKKIAKYNTEDKMYRNITKLKNIKEVIQFNESLFGEAITFLN